jgi:hypothetical protein
MRVQIGMLSGIVDIHMLFGIFMLTATTMLFGWLMETMNGKRLTCFADDGTHLTVRYPVHVCEVHAVAHGPCPPCTFRVIGMHSGGLRFLPRLAANSLCEMQATCAPERSVESERYAMQTNHSGLPHGQSKSHINWEPFVFGFVPHLSAWAIVACHFFHNVANGNPPNVILASITALGALKWNCRSVCIVASAMRFKQCVGHTFALSCCTAPQVQAISAAALCSLVGGPAVCLGDHLHSLLPGPAFCSCPVSAVQASSILSRVCAG